MLEAKRCLPQSCFASIFGKVNAAGEESSDIFHDNTINELPDVVPLASTRRVELLLAENNISPSGTLKTTTVRGLVTELSKNLGIETWKEDMTNISQVSSRRILDQLQIHIAASETQNKAASSHIISESKSIEDPTKPLGDLTLQEVANLMKNMCTGVSAETIQLKFVDGALLLAIESSSDLDELELNMSNIRKAQFLRNILKWKGTGVPIAFLT